MAESSVIPAMSLPAVAGDDVVIGDGDRIPVETGVQVAAEKAARAENIVSLHNSLIFVLHHGPRVDETAIRRGGQGDEWQQPDDHRIEAGYRNAVAGKRRAGVGIANGRGD